MALAAAWAAREGLGLLHLVQLPRAAAVLLAVVLLDCAIYAQHVVFHRVPLLWRLHRVHHTDPDYDVSTAARFHPVEILLSMGIKIVAVVALGAPPLAVVIFEVVLSTTALFNHGNVGLPLALDRVVRWVIVTPDMHRVHHSVLRAETDSNFGFNLPWWDRLFGTYRAQPARGHVGMRIGLQEFPGAGSTSLGRLLLQPLESPGGTPASGSPAGQREAGEPGRPGDSEPPGPGC